MAADEQGVLKRDVEAVALAVVAEVILVAIVLLLLFAVPKIVRSQPAPVILELAQAPVQEPPQPELPKPKPPKPTLPEPPPRLQPPTLPPLTPPPPVPPPPLITPPADLGPVAEPTPFSQAAVPPPPPPPPAAYQAAKVDPMLAYAAQVKAAVQGAVQYPAAAQRQRIGGRTRVEFNLRDGRVSEPHLVQGSGTALLDRAAIAAVLAAGYPAPPSELAGIERQFQVWVEFRRYE